MKTHKYLNIQSDETMTVLFRADNPSKVILVDDPSHPLFGLKDTSALLQTLPALKDVEVAAIMECGFFHKLQDVDDAFSSSDRMEKKELLFRLFPTLNCNSKCRYCYQEHHGQPTMDNRDYLAVKTAVDRYSRVGISIHLAFFGGEPLLEAESIMPFTRDCRALCDIHGVGFAASMTTNGRLMANRALTRNILDAGVDQFQITLDGSEDVHDYTRPGANGEKTYAQTLAGLYILQEQAGDFTCTIRVNHSTMTSDDNILKKFHENMRRFVGDYRFQLYHVAASDMGGDPDRSLFLDIASARKTVQRANDMSLEYGLQLNDSFHVPGGRVCYAALPDRFGVLPGGTLIKCTDDIFAPHNSVGRLTPEGKLELNDNHRLWLDFEPDKKCRACSVAPICQGKACPLKRLESGVSPCPDVKHDERFYLRAIRSAVNGNNLKTKEV